MQGLRQVLKREKFAFVATYPPTECGIATFTRDLVEGMKKVEFFHNLYVVTVSKSSRKDELHPPEVQFLIEKENLLSYLTAAEKINNESFSLVNLQHEFGIFGGRDGEFILPFLEKLKVPVVTTFHTVSSTLTEHQKGVLQCISNLSTALVVMANSAVKILSTIYGIPRNKIQVIHHGVPEVFSINKLGAKLRLKLEKKWVISTFGLINRGKGLEYAILALPKIIEKYPNVIYLIVGETHPEVAAQEKESYRQELERLVQKLHLQDQVKFVNKYLALAELVDYLLATDIYLTPYLNKNQIVSGTLAYALGCGKAIISTPYFYAEEMLSQDRGILVEFRNYQQIADAVINLLDNPQLIKEKEERAYAIGSQMTWKKVGQRYLNLFTQILEERRPVVQKVWQQPSLPGIILPSPNFYSVKHTK